MSVTGKTMIGLVFVVVGATVMLNIFGIHLGGLVKLAVALCLVIYGIKKIANGQKWFGSAVLAFGLLLIVGIPGLIFQALFALMIVYFGFRLLTGGKREAVHEGGVLRPRIDDDFDREWQRFMKD